MTQITKSTHNGYEWVVNVNNSIDNVEALVYALKNNNKPFEYNNETKELFAEIDDCREVDDNF